MIKRKSDKAYAALRCRIMCAELPPGELLDERALMDSLQVGRTPLREAVLRLEQERLVRSLGRRGYVVAETSPSDLFRAFELRREIECFAAARAAERRTMADLEAFDAFLARAAADMEARADDPTWNLEADENFHLLVVAASDNRFAAETLGHLYGISVRSLYISRVQATLVRDEIGLYREVFGAIRNRDARARGGCDGPPSDRQPAGGRAGRRRCDPSAKGRQLMRRALRERVVTTAMLAPSVGLLSIFVLLPLCIVAAYSFALRDAYGGVVIGFTLDNYRSFSAASTSRSSSTPSFLPR